MTKTEAIHEVAKAITEVGTALQILSGVAPQMKDGAIILVPHGYDRDETRHATRLLTMRIIEGRLVVADQVTVSALLGNALGSMG